MANHPDDLYAFWTELSSIKEFSQEIDRHPLYSPAQRALAEVAVIRYRRLFDEKYRRSVTGDRGKRAFSKDQWPLDVEQLGSEERAVHDWLIMTANRWVAHLGGEYSVRHQDIDGAHVVTHDRPDLVRDERLREPVQRLVDSLLSQIQFPGAAPKDENPSG